MLVSFTVKNFKSFSEEQEFSMVAGKNTSKKDTISFKTSNNMAPELLRSAGIFGANASGKTSLIQAMRFFKYFVIHSANNMDDDQEIETKPHLFDKQYMDKPSEFECIFVYKNELYQYGFSVDKKKVYEEWLFAKPNDSENFRTRHIFGRQYKGMDKDGKDKYEWHLNQIHLKGQKNIWKDATRSDSLFLSQAVQLNSEQLRIPFQWIQKNLRFMSNIDYRGGIFTLKQFTEKEKSKEILQLLQSLNTKIINLDIKSENEESIDTDLPDELKQVMKELKKLQKVKTIHKTKDGDEVALRLRDESSGTQNMFRLAGPWLDVLENGYTLVVDELHNNLHPHALESLIRLFHNLERNKNNAQLIFTSHETSVMQYDFMDKDQYWITEKTKFENTRLIPLSDYDIKKSNNIEKSYLNGRYGGIPIIQEIV